MKMEEFINAVRTRVQDIAGMESRVDVHEVRKNNNVLLHGMTIMRQGQNVSPTIYLDGFYEMLCDGEELEHIVKRILEVYVRGLPRNHVDMEFFKDFTKVKERIVYRLVNRQKNEELLTRIPHVEFLDLAICFYYSYEHPELGAGMILIHNTHMKLWKTSHRELMKLAEINTPRLMPSCLCSMDDALEGVLDGESMEEFQKLQRETQKYLYVLSNATRCQGAAAILYPGVLAQAARQLRGSFYILPSSIHEVILLSDQGQDSGNGLHEMIADINQSQLREEDVLSDYAYRYDAVTGKVAKVL
ncbi:MAG: DUF5688 family protein [bacterium]|nr:DUF5688 family protein [bacterium]MCM1376372.1 DUF5688 family protein [Muribaculum sp.]